MNITFCIFRFLLVLFVLFPRICFAYPSAEITGSNAGDPPLSFGVTATISGFGLISDRRLALSYSESLRIADMGYFALESSQPPALNTTDETDGIIGGIAYESSGNIILASQEDGDLLIFDLSDITATPGSIELASGDTLGPVVADENGLYAYVADNTSQSIHVVDLLDRSLSHTIELTISGVESFTVTEGIFVDSTDEAYFTTSGGSVVYIASGASSASYILISSDVYLSSLAAYPNEDYIYVVDADNAEIYRISTSTHQIVAQDIDISANPAPTDIVITDITNPSATYAYVAGDYGVSFIDAGNDEVIDMGSDPDIDGEPLETSATPYWLAASSSTDGYVYMGFATGYVGVLSANPWVNITDIAYSSGGSQMGAGESFTVTFRSNVDGDYEIRAGGSITADGTLLTDSAGAQGGSVTADTDTAVAINYDDNSGAFAEGANALWVFVTSGSNRGREAATVTIDTPPGDVAINSTSFGDGRIYVIFDRITAADMSVYRFYADTDEATALAMTDPTAEVAQAASGATQTAEIGGLTNGTLYYVAVEAVDAAGNTSATRSVTSEVPAATEGPAGLLGEKGCSLVADVDGDARLSIFLLLSLPPAVLIGISLRRRWRGISAAFALFLLFALYSAEALAQAGYVEEKKIAAVEFGKESPQWWEFEVKTGFWLPQNDVLNSIFTPCCNLITRVQGGFLYDHRYGVGVGVGFLYKTANALGTGAHAGQPSGDRFSFLLIPIETNFTWRLQYIDPAYIVPYMRAGLDYVIFREGVAGRTTKGVKYGVHGGMGLQLDLGAMADVSRDLDFDFGINDFYLTLEGMYQWINDFGGGGLDLSGPVFSIGFLFEF